MYGAVGGIRAAFFSIIAQVICDSLSRGLWANCKAITSSLETMSSEIYNKLARTAQYFVMATSPRLPGSNVPDPERFLACLAADFQMSWGHSFFVSTKPPLQGTVDGEGFCQHQGGMAKKLETWQIEPTSTCVDVEKHTAVVRADFSMKVRSAEAVINDIVFWISMYESGEKVTQAIEFVDPVASAEIAERMKMSTTVEDSTSTSES